MVIFKVLINQNLEFSPIYVSAPKNYEEKFSDLTRGIGNALSEVLSRLDYPENYHLKEVDSITENEYTLLSYKNLEDSIPDDELENSSSVFELND